MLQAHDPPNESSASTLSLKERQRQEREQLILQATAELLVESGYHDTSLDEIASRVGISKGAIYLHFASKEDLVFALLERNMRLFYQTLDDALSGAATPREKLLAVVKAYTTMNRHAHRLRAAIFESPEFMGRLTERHGDLAAMWNALGDKLSAVLDEGKATGEFDATVPTPVLLNIVRSVFTMHANPHLSETDQLSPNEVAWHLTRFLLKGIAPGDMPPVPETGAHTHEQPPGCGDRDGGADR